MAEKLPDWINPEGGDGFLPGEAQLTSGSAEWDTSDSEPRSSSYVASIRETKPAETTIGVTKPAPPSAALSQSSTGGKGKLIAIGALAVVGLAAGLGVALASGGSSDTGETASEATPTTNESVTSAEPAPSDEPAPGRLASAADADADADPSETEADAAPEDTTPESTEPENTQPEDTALEDTALEDTEPEDTMAVEPESSVEDASDAGETSPEAELRYGRFADGKITLVGPVPDRETADELVDAAGEVIGPDNVIDQYTIDPEAPASSNGLVIVDDPVLFAPGSVDVNPDFIPLLDLGVTVLALNPQASMRIVGHTDDVGEAEANQILSEGRAQAIVDYMVGKGADASKFEAVGAGESQPIASNDSESGRQANRRIDVEILNLVG